MTPLIRYSVNHTPQYAGWDAPYAPGTFLFTFKAVVEVHRRLIGSDLPHVHMHSRSHGIYHEYLQRVEALAWLERKWLGYYQNDVDDVAPWPEHLGSLWNACSPLILEKHFVSVWCSACDATYFPKETTVREFSWGETLFGHGGRGLLCPKEHGLFVICEWNS